RGDRRAYRVALDAVPEGAEPRDGKMARAWMTAAAQWYVPRAFIVNADGKVAWVGHPQALDGPLGQIVAGTYDLKAAAAAYHRARVEKTLLQALVKARQAGDPDAPLGNLDTAIAPDGKLEEPL